MLFIATVAGALLTGRPNVETVVDVLKGLLLIPKFAPMEAGTFPSLFPFNPLAWSLCLEVLVSLAWFPLRRAPDMAIIMFVLLAGAALLFVAVGMGGLQTGWDQATFGLGVLRASFPFAIGWLCWRHRRSFAARKAWLPAALLLFVLVLPTASTTSPARPCCFRSWCCRAPMIPAAGWRAGASGWAGCRTRSTRCTGRSGT
jgi:peptidoglycan/LPS O-acetylase OafA/YrhL